MGYSFEELVRVAEGMCKGNPSFMYRWHPETLESGYGTVADVLIATVTYLKAGGLRIAFRTASMCFQSPSILR
ncbi:MAG: hypothetical protein ABSD63_00215 [Candidatus Korobacteraceae bacterium]|jgi:hypothetical protein